MIILSLYEFSLFVQITRINEEMLIRCIKIFIELEVF